MQLPNSAIVASCLQLTGNYGHDYNGIRSPGIMGGLVVIHVVAGVAAPLLYPKTVGVHKNDMAQIRCRAH